MADNRDKGDSDWIYIVLLNIVAFLLSPYVALYTIKILLYPFYLMAVFFGYL